jgi:hypothetical protein
MKQTREQIKEVLKKHIAEVVRERKAMVLRERMATLRRGPELPPDGPGGRARITDLDF